MLASLTTSPGRLVLLLLCLIALGRFKTRVSAQDIALPHADLATVSDPAVRSISDMVPAEEVHLSVPCDVGSGSSLMDQNVRSWITPSRWFLPPIWELSIELGINGSDGNAQSISLLTSGHVKRETERSILQTEIVYGKSEANSVLTQHYGFFESRWDLKMGESRWSYFNMFRLEFDEFKVFDYRVSLSTGVGYAFIDRDTRQLAGRFGSGASREFGGGDETWVPEAVFGADYEHKLSKRQKLSANVDYFPAWEDFADFRVVSKASWELLLDEETNLNLKIGLIDRYDSTPFGLRPNDVDYFVTLLWKK